VKPPRAHSRAAARARTFLSAAGCLLALALLAGCASTPPPTAKVPRPFDFQKDTFAFPNELLWEYSFDTNGNWTAHRREPKPSYTLHCVVLARSAIQFFENAEFCPNEPVTNTAAYRRLIRRVISTSPRSQLPESAQIRIPGYPDLRSFSQAHEDLLKAECGGAWQSYFQRGNWRMVFPFSHSGQEHMAQKLLLHVKPGHPVAIHVSTFPKLSINHTVVAFEAKDIGTGILFTTYDPNQPNKPSSLLFDRATRTFLLPACNYFAGGRVDVYEIYYKWDY
jgi:hypothetical protein